MPVKYWEPRCLSAESLARSAVEVVPTVCRLRGFGWWCGNDSPPLGTVLDLKVHVEAPRPTSVGEQRRSELDEWGEKCGFPVFTCFLPRFPVQTRQNRKSTGQSPARQVRVRMWAGRVSASPQIAARGSVDSMQGQVTSPGTRGLQMLAAE